MNIGQTVRVYHYRRDLDKTVVCDLGCKHRATVHEVKRLTITQKRVELVPFLGYDKDAYGDVFEAVDAQGRTYTYTPSWDGPGAWRREGTDKTFWSRPILKRDVAYDLAGNII